MRPNSAKIDLIIWQCELDPKDVGFSIGLRQPREASAQMFVCDFQSSSNLHTGAYRQLREILFQSKHLWVRERAALASYPSWGVLVPFVVSYQASDELIFVTAPPDKCVRFLVSSSEQSEHYHAPLYRFFYYELLRAGCISAAALTP